MFERRPILGLILGLNVCVLIWRISVQEPAMIEQEMMLSGGGGGGGVGGGLSIGAAAIDAQQERTAGSKYLYKTSQQSKQHQQQTFEFRSEFSSLQQQLYGGKRLLAEKSHHPSNENDSNSAVNNNVVTEGLVPRRKYKLKASTSLTQQDDRSSSSSSNRIRNRYSSKQHKRNQNDSSQTLAINTRQVNYIATPISRLTVPALATTTAASSQANITLVAASTKNAFAPNDHTHLIDLPNFHYLMTQPSCATDVAALILVHSAPHNYEKRQLIRETWGSITTARSSALRLVFLLGAVKEEGLQLKLKSENDWHADMVQGNFYDDYRNMTYKHIMAFKWFLYHCATAQLLIKVDDDVFVNTPQLLRYLRNANTTTATTTSTNTRITTNTTTDNEAAAFTVTSGTVSNNASNATPSQFNAADTLFQHPSNLLFCQESVGSHVKRSYRSKWRVSFKEYSARYYPPYCPGYAIIYSSDVVLRLYNVAQQQHYFWIDDVHITGVLAQQTHLNITTLKPYVLFSNECERLLAGKTDLSQEEFLFAWHSISPTQIRALWRLFPNSTVAASSYPPSATSWTATTAKVTTATKTIITASPTATLLLAESATPAFNYNDTRAASTHGEHFS